MKVKSEKVSDIKKKIEVTLPMGMVQQAIEVAYGKLQKKVNLKGFRPGKAPRAMLEKHYREDAEQDAVQELVGSSYGLALEETQEQPVSHPDIKLIQFGGDKELIYEAVFEIRPEVKVKDYKKLKLKKDAAQVTEEEVAKSLQEMQEQAAQLIPVTIRTRPQVGDFAVVDYQGSVDGKAIPGGEVKDYIAPLGAKTLFPEIEEALLGTEVGEKKTIQVKMPDNFEDKKLAGKSVTYQIEVKGIKEKKLPELNDDFAKDLGPYQTLEEIRQKLREAIQKRKEGDAQAKLHRDLLQKLAEENPCSVPEAMVHAELDHMYQRLEGNLKQQGMTPEKIGITRELFVEKNHEEAVLQVKGGLFFDTIATEQGITVTPEEVEQKIVEMAKASGQAPEHWMKHYREKKLLPGLQMALREEKTLAFVLSQVTIT